MNLPITINTTRLKPELFNQTCKPLIGFSSFGVRLFVPCVIPTRMNIEHFTEPTNRPIVRVFFNKGIPQSDCFAKYAADFFNRSRSAVVRFSSFCNLLISACASLNSLCCLKSGPYFFDSSIKAMRCNI